MRIPWTLCLVLIVCFHGVMCAPEKARKGKPPKKERKGKKAKKAQDKSYQTGKCAIELREAAKEVINPKGDVMIPSCKPDGSYNEIQCHRSSNYCWCVTKDGKHIPGTSVKGRKPSCKGSNKKKRRKSRGNKSKKKKSCNNKERQIFNSALIKVFKDEYDRVVTTPAPSARGTASNDFGTEKAIVDWKFTELDANQDGILRFKEIRPFSRMVKKLIKPKACARKFMTLCDKGRNRAIEKSEWSLCLGVDIRLSFRIFISLNSATAVTTRGHQQVPTSVQKELFVRPAPSFLKEPDVPPLRAKPSAASQHAAQNRPANLNLNCREAHSRALIDHAQEPDANHFIPKCTAQGKYKKAQCHTSGYCWCVQENTGVPVPGTATLRVTPNCTFENERVMKGCPFQQKRRFLVDLLGDLTLERRKALKGNQSSVDLGNNMSQRESVARWKWLALDLNSNGLLERKEWRPFRKTTLKNKRYPRKCRRSFLRYCDKDNNKRIAYTEWKDCLGLNNSYFNNLPLSPKRKGKNPFVTQLT